MTLDVLQANVDLLAEKERLEHERQRLVALDRFKTEFLARVSHDLRTPLNSILGFSQLLAANIDGKLNRKQQELVSAISRNGQTLLSLISDLLDLSTLEAGQMALRREEVPLATLLADLKAATEPLLQSARLRITWPDVASLGARTAFVDRRRMLQVLVNLVDNARKFTPAGGLVAVEMESVPEGTRFVVADDGPGIPADERERIFKPFQQRSINPQNLPLSELGVGLGLAIVKAIVDRHGGSIELASGIGTGCRFRVWMPRLKS